MELPENGDGDATSPRRRASARDGVSSGMAGLGGLGGGGSLRRRYSARGRQTVTSSTAAAGGGVVAAGVRARLGPPRVELSAELASADDIEAAIRRTLSTLGGGGGVDGAITPRRRESAEGSVDAAVAAAEAVAAADRGAAAAAATAAASEGAASEEVIKKFRWLRALSRRYERTTGRLQNFWRLRVKVDRPDVSFHVVVDKRMTVSELIYFIEAKYAYTFLLPPRGEDGDYNTDPSVLPLQCGLLYDADMNTLRFDKTLEEVLEFDTVVHALNTLEDLSPIQLHTPSLASATKGGLPGAAAGDGDDDDDVAVQVDNPLIAVFKRNSIRCLSETPGLTGSDGPQVTIATVQEEPDDEAEEGATAARLAVPDHAGGGSGMGRTSRSPSAVGRDLSITILPARSGSRASGGLNLFGYGPAGDGGDVGGAASPSTVAALADRFRAAVRNGQSLQWLAEFCIEDRSAENLLFWTEVEMLLECPRAFRLSYAQYIYYVYLAPHAPLKVNVLQDLLNDTRCPDEGDSLDQMVFDEVQQHVLAVLVGHTFARFEKSPRTSELWKKMLSDPKQYQQHAFSKSLFDELQPRAALVSRFLDRFLMERGVSQPALERQGALGEILRSLVPGCEGVRLDGYFNGVQRRRTAQRRVRLLKEKKISKFFGQRPGFEHLQRQVPVRGSGGGGAHGGMEDMDDEHEFGGDGSGAVGRVYGGGGNLSEAVSADHDRRVSSTVDGSDLFVRRKKAEKLAEFFGESVAGAELRRQKLAFQNVCLPQSGLGEEGAADGDLAPLDTTNELDPEEKRRIARQSKKLALLMGDPVPAEYRSRAAATAVRRRSDGSEPAAAASMEAGGRADHAEDEANELFRELDDESGGSGDEDGDRSAEQQQLRAARRRRLMKLTAVLGEASRTVETAKEEAERRAQAAAAAAAASARSPLSPQQRRAQMRRANKLEKVMGKVVPAEMLGNPAAAAVCVDDDDSDFEGLGDRGDDVLGDLVASGVDGEKTATEVAAVQGGSVPRPRRRLPSAPAIGQAAASAVQRHRENINRISAIINGEEFDRAMDLIDRALEVELDLTSGTASPPAVGGGWVAKAPAAQTTTGAQSSSSGAAAMATRQQKLKAARQRRVQKLRRFFGDDHGVVGPSSSGGAAAARLFEQQVVESLAAMIAVEVDDPGELAELQQRLNALRGSVRDRSGGLEEALERRQRADENVEAAQSMAGFAGPSRDANTAA
ncbi:hypothetical protein HK405_003488 [Cladochytrium tenue]|nr:hypothetical protein HK405_003488 [Cladochytrium tenue]